MYKEFNNIKKFCFYVNSSGNRLSAAQVKKHVGCDIVINGSLYDMNTFKATCKVKANKKILSTNQYSYNGYGWNNGSNTLTMTTDMDAYDNYISCVCLVNYGQKQPLYGTAGMNGVRGRTAIGVKKDGTVVIYVSKDGQSGSYGACTIETLQQRMLALGCYTALNLDGGGSSQYESDTDKITSSRRVHNYICIWLNKEEKKPVAPAKPVVQTQAKPAATPKTAKYKVNTNSLRLNVRKGAGTIHPIVATLAKNTVVEITIISNGWGYIPAKKGWVSMSYMKKI